MSDSSRSSRRRIFGGLSLAGAVGLLLVCVFVALGAGVLLFREGADDGLVKDPDEVMANSPLADPFASTLDAPDPQTALLQGSRGQVEIQVVGGIWESAAAGEMIASGGRLRTGPLSSATLALYDGCLVTLGSDTEVLIAQLDARRDGPRVIEIVQVSGETFHVVAQSTHLASVYEVFTPSGSGRVQGTVFAVTVSANQESSFSVVEGAVAVTAAGETVVATAGETTSLHSGEPPLPPASAFSGEGTVTQIGEFWIIGGQAMLVDPATLIVGDPQVGDWAAFAGRILPGGVRVADQITLIHFSVVDTFSFNGTVETISDTSWVVSGLTLSIVPETVIDAEIEVGDQVEVSGTIAEGNVFLAGEIHLLDETAGLAFNFAGVVEAIGPDEWVVSDIAVAITAETVIDPDIVTGDVVQVSGQILPEGIWRAEAITRVAESGTFDFAGVVISTNPWNVSGVPFGVDAGTQIDDGIQTGNRVRVRGVVLPTGEWLAESILQYDQGQRHAIHFTARVETIDPWLIGGTLVTVDNHTQILGEIAVGDLVSVRGNLLPGGEVVANKIILVAADSTCTLTVGTVAAFDGQTLSLLDGQTIVLPPELVLDVDLAVNDTIVIETCPDDDGLPIITGLTLLEEGDQVTTDTSGSGDQGQVVICHIPSGDLSRARTLSVAASAVDSHLAHGDLLGPCP